MRFRRIIPIEKPGNMWKCWILILCATGILSALVESENYNVNSVPKSLSRDNHQHEIVRRFACPVGFFRLKRFCYYLSGGTASWRDAHFHCKDRNATLAVLDRKGKDRILRKYLVGDQFTKLERWIGGIFNWEQMAWLWGLTGEKMSFQNFGKTVSKSEKYAWHCIVMDPSLKYMWNARECYERKHYICETSAGRIPRKHQKFLDPTAPQNQRLKPQKRGKKYRGTSEKLNNRKHIRPAWKRKWAEQHVNQQWAHGVNVGSRPPSNVRVAHLRGRIRHHSNRTQPEIFAAKVVQIPPQGQEHGAFLGDGPSRANNQPQSLADMNDVLSQFHAKINDFAREEVLLKP